VRDSRSVSSRRPENLADLVRDAAARRPDHPAITVGATRLTWADVDAAVDAVAAGLRSLGLADGDRVGLVLGNRPEFVLAYFGALRAGCVAVPLNPGFTTPEIAQLLGHAGVRLVVSDRESSGAVRQAHLPDATRVVVGPAGEDETRFDDLLATGRTLGPVAASTGGEDLAVILYTSGSSGDPKGAMLTHRAMRASVEQVASLDTPVVSPDDIVLVVLPLAHVYSLNGTLAAVARQAATAVLVDRFDTDATMRAVSEYGVTNIPGAPSLWLAWSKRPDLAEALSGVRILFSGSAALPPAVSARIADSTGMFVYEGYGLTEAAPGVSSTLVTEEVKPGSVGHPFPGVEVRLVDEDGHDVDPEEMDPGEIWIRGDNLFSGYWPDGLDGPDDDGWYATGDVAYVDEDGDLHLVDRRKELILVHGFNVYPREVEEVLQLHPAVAEAAVVGMPYEPTGEAVKAYVVARPGQQVTPEELANFCETRLARFKRPHDIELVDALPHTVTGKVVKGRLGDHG
jgi:long-chain acyl-CoA synthetase